MGGVIGWEEPGMYAALRRPSAASSMNSRPSSVVT